MVIEVSAPKVKNPIPKIRNTAPMKNNIITLFDTGATEKHTKATIIVIGNTDEMESFILSFSFSFNKNQLLFKNHFCI